MRTRTVMTEKLIVFAFAGILGTMLYHLGLGMVSARYLATAPLFLTFWYVPHILLPLALLLAFGWWLGFLRWKGSRWADIGLLLITAIIVFCTIGAPYNCLNQFCF